MPRAAGPSDGSAGPVGGRVGWGCRSGEGKVPGGRSREGMRGGELPRRAARSRTVEGKRRARIVVSVSVYALNLSSRGNYVRAAPRACFGRRTAMGRGRSTRPGHPRRNQMAGADDEKASRGDAEGTEEKFLCALCVSA